MLGRVAQSNKKSKDIFSPAKLAGVSREIIGPKEAGKVLDPAVPLGMKQ
jgi:hypothetical protein